MSTEITPLFGCAIYHTNIESELNMAELVAMMNESDINQKEKLEINTGNRHTVEQYFLKRYEESVLAKTIKKHLNIYFHNILMASDDIEIYITQSWLNRNDPGDFHHGHTHPSSFVSGTFYYQADNRTGQFVCSDNRYTPLEYEKKDYNIFNSNAWKFTPKPYELYLFPSHVVHKVEPNESNITRISLAFNTYLRGIINRHPTTGLILK